LKDFLGSLLKIIIIIVIAIVLVNDVGNYLLAKYNSGDKAKVVAQEALNIYQKSRSLSTAKLAAIRKAQEIGVEFKSLEYKPVPPTMEVTIVVPVKRTLLLSRVEQLKKYTKVDVGGEAHTNIDKNPPLGKNTL